MESSNIGGMGRRIGEEERSQKAVSGGEKNG